MNNDSFIKVTVEWLQERINVKRAAIEKARDKQWTELFVRRSRKRDFWMKLFPRMKVLTFEEFKDTYRESNYVTPDIRYGQQEQVLDRLKHLIDTKQGEHIMLCGEDAGYL